MYSNVSMLTSPSEGVYFFLHFLVIGFYIKFSKTTQKKKKRARILFESYTQQILHFECKQLHHVKHKGYKTI